MQQVAPADWEEEEVKGRGQLKSSVGRYTNDSMPRRIYAHAKLFRSENNGGGGGAASSSPAPFKAAWQEKGEQDSSTRRYK